MIDEGSVHLHNEAELEMLEGLLKLEQKYH